ncbi:MAG: hypothetical protein RMJ19_01255 [Gemmatales bacterium]|nr:hypothetical protein [Gemmatales bacterium]MDW8174274.1 hypothetical protein [Gemmatales bacterium]
MKALRTGGELFDVHLELDGNNCLEARYLHCGEFEQVLARVIYTSPLSSAEDSAPCLVQLVSDRPS